MEGIREQFIFGPITSSNETDIEQSSNILAEKTLDPKEIEMSFKNLGARNKIANDHSSSNKPLEKQENSRKFENLRKYPCLAVQDMTDVLPKRVSFNDIPDVIAERKTMNQKFLPNQETEWDSDYSDDESESNNQRQVKTRQRMC